MFAWFCGAKTYTIIYTYINVAHPSLSRVPKGTRLLTKFADECVSTCFRELYEYDAFLPVEFTLQIFQQ